VKEMAPNHKPNNCTVVKRGGKPEAKSRPEGHEPHQRRDGQGEPAQYGEAWSSRDRNVDAAGARGRLVLLSWEACRGVGRDACRPTPVAGRRPVTRQESAEAVVAAGSCAAKGRTRSRGKARPCLRKATAANPVPAGPSRNGRHADPRASLLAARPLARSPGSARGGHLPTATDQEGDDPKALRRRAGAGGADGPGSSDPAGPAAGAGGSLRSRLLGARPGPARSTDGPWLRGGPPTSKC
jgi:hypothetical protein